MFFKSSIGFVIYTYHYTDYLYSSVGKKAINTFFNIEHTITYMSFYFLNLDSRQNQNLRHFTGHEIPGESSKNWIKYGKTRKSWSHHAPFGDCNAFQSSLVGAVL